MTEIFRSYFYDAKKNKARSKGATAAYFIFFILLMASRLTAVYLMGLLYSGVVIVPAVIVYWVAALFALMWVLISRSFLKLVY